VIILHKFKGFLLLLLVFSLSACSDIAQISAEYESVLAAAAFGEAPVLNVTVTFDALYEFASAIGSGRVSVSRIIPDGANAHHFEPRARDLSALRYADLFIKSGLGFEPWANAAVRAAGNDSLIVIEASKGIEPIALDCVDHCHSHGHSHRHSTYDPHIWLSLRNAGTMAENIKLAFIDADPVGADYYRQNLAEFAGHLDALFDEYYRQFQNLENRTIVVSHAVFAYLCRDFGLVQNSIQGVFAEGEPNARALAGLVEFSRNNNVTAVLTERLASPILAESLANEIDADVKIVYTIENAEDGLSYLERMAKNLAVIYEVLR